MSLGVAAITGVGMAGSGPGGPGSADIVGSDNNHDRRLRHARWESVVLFEAARRALLDADAIAVGPRAGIVLGTRTAGRNAFAELYSGGRASTSGRVPPALGPHVGPNAPAAQLAILLGAQGPNVTVTSGAVSTFAALDLAIGAIEDGSADVVLVCSVEEPASAAPTAVDDDGAVVLVLEPAGADTVTGPRRRLAVSAPHLRAFEPGAGSQAVDLCRAAVGEVLASIDCSSGAIIVANAASQSDPLTRLVLEGLAVPAGWTVASGEAGPLAFARRVQSQRLSSATDGEVVVLVDPVGRLSVVATCQQPEGVGRGNC